MLTQAKSLGEASETERIKRVLWRLVTFLCAWCDPPTVLFFCFFFGNERGYDIRGHESGTTVFGETTLEIQVQYEVAVRLFAAVGSLCSVVVCLVGR